MHLSKMVCVTLNVYVPSIHREDVGKGLLGGVGEVGKVKRRVSKWLSLNTEC